MMMNLFSSFDSSANFNTNFNWMSTMLSILFIPSMFWFIPSQFNIMWYTIIIITL